MTSPVRKKFSHALYEAYDGKAKEALVSLLSSRGHAIIHTDETYYVDVVSFKEGNTFYNECEVKVAWEGDWPTSWEEIRIPERKVRLLDKCKEERGFLNFYIFDKDVKKAWRIKDTALTEERLREAHGRYIQAGEKFYHIPYTEAVMVEVP